MRRVLQTFKPLPKIWRRQICLSRKLLIKVTFSSHAEASLRPLAQMCSDLRASRSGNGTRKMSKWKWFQARKVVAKLADSNFCNSKFAWDILGFALDLLGLSSVCDLFFGTLGGDFYLLIFVLNPTPTHKNSDSKYTSPDHQTWPIPSKYRAHPLFSWFLLI